MGKMNKRKRRTESWREPVSNPSADKSVSGLKGDMAFIALAHMLFIVMAAFVLTVSFTVARFSHYYVGLIAVGIAALAMIIQYQRIGAATDRLSQYLGAKQKAARELPDYYVAALSIFHFIPLIVLFYNLENGFWVYQHQVEILSTPNTLPVSNHEGIYHIADSEPATSLGFFHATHTLKGSRAAGTEHLGAGTTWMVAPLVSGMVDQEVVALRVQAGEQCVWIGSNNGDAWIKDRLQATDDSPFFQQRHSRDIQKYQRILEEGAGETKLPSCTRILEKIPPPDVLQETYWKSSLFMISLAHGIPLALLAVFYFLAKPKQKRNQTL